VDALHWIEKRGVYVMNSPRAIERAVDKFYTTALLQEAGLPTPDTVVCEGLDDAMAAVRAMLQDLTASMQFYLERPREARQLLIDARMVRVLPDVYMNMQDYYRDPTLRVDAEALEKMQAFQIKAGFQSKNADVRSLVDLSYLPQ